MEPMIPESAARTAVSSSVPQPGRSVMRYPIPVVASVLAATVPAPLLAHGGHEAAGAGLLHALVHVLPGLVPAALVAGGAVWFVTRHRRADSS